LFSGNLINMNETFPRSEKWLFASWFPSCNRHAVC
jgi:hypothetical protein